MKHIFLNTGEGVRVDDDDYPLLVRHRWFLSGGKYAATTIGSRAEVRMHEFILPSRPGFVADHKNGEMLDNRKCNLRYATASQNSQNKTRAHGQSKYKGVHFLKDKNRWRSSVSLNGKHFHCGTFKTEEEAARARDKKANELFGEFASPNFQEV